MARINLRKLTPAIRKKYKAYNNALKLDLIKNPKKDRKGEPKDEINVIVGDDKQPDRFYPQVKICRWSNEVNLSFRLKEDDKEEPIIDFDRHKVLYKKNKKECHFYHIEPNEKLREGGYEFEVILKEKPSTNKIEFTINTKRLKFYYQPPLTKEFRVGQKDGDREIVKVTETDAYVRDENGKLVSVAHRPENVVGSYAVYHESKGGAVEKNDKDYKVGKVGHIYRPKIIDANGNETWGKLNIDEKRGILSVEIPQEFLDNVVYPVKVDPTFGYDTLGSSYSDKLADRLYGWKYGGSNGNAISITMGGHYTDKWKGILVLASDKTIITNGVTGEGASSGYKEWVSASFGTSPSISAVDYFISLIWRYNYDGVWYDSTNDIDYLYDGSNFYFSPSDPTDGDVYPNSNKYSIYCTYEAGATEVTVTATAKARILKNYTKTIQAKARLKATLNKTVSAKARILTSGVTKTVTAKARVKQAGISKTITAKARVKQVGVSKTVTTKSRILQERIKDISAKARIKRAGISKTIQSKARILATSSKTVSAKARVKQTGLLKTILAKADIKQVGIEKTITGKARVKQAGITKTISGKARILRIVTKTADAKARIKQTLDKIVSSRARIVRTITETVTAKARIKKLGTGKTVTAKARLLKEGIGKTVSGRARIKIVGGTLKSHPVSYGSFSYGSFPYGGGIVEVLGQKVVRARARIVKLVTKTIQARARIFKAGVSKTITAKARVKQTGITKNVDAKARILQTRDKTITVRARVKNTLTKTISAKAKIAVPTITKTVTAKARIFTPGISKNVTAKARVKQINITKNIQAKARILQVLSKTVTVRARIFKPSITKTISAKARVKQIGISKSITSQARILQIVTKTLKSRARILQNISRTIQTKARIKRVGEGKVISSRARIKQADITKNVRARAKIKKIVSKTIQARADIKRTIPKAIGAKARIEIPQLTKTITARARIKQVGIDKTIVARARIKQVGVGKTVEAKARILKTFVKNITAKAKITYWFGEGLKYATTDAYPQLGKSIPYPSARSQPYQLAKSIY